jgi:type III secretory pathway component EscU
MVPIGGRLSSMEFDAGSLLASLLVSSVGFVLLSYGKKMARVPHMAIGVVLLVFPYFVSGALWTLLIGGALLVSLWLLVQRGL